MHIKIVVDILINICLRNISSLHHQPATELAYTGGDPPPKNTMLGYIKNSRITIASGFKTHQLPQDQKNTKGSE
jgi:hypothetical protein